MKKPTTQHDVKKLFTDEEFHNLIKLAHEVTYNVIELLNIAMPAERLPKKNTGAAMVFVLETALPTIVFEFLLNTYRLTPPKNRVSFQELQERLFHNVSVFIESYIESHKMPIEEIAMIKPEGERNV